MGSLGGESEGENDYETPELTPQLCISLMEIGEIQRGETSILLEGKDNFTWTFKVFE